MKESKGPDKRQTLAHEGSVLVSGRPSPAPPGRLVRLEALS